MDGTGWDRVVSHPGLPQIRTCRITAYGSSDHAFASRYTSRTHSSAIRCRFVDMILKLGVFVMFLSNGVVVRYPLLVFPSLPRVALGGLPLVRRYYEGTMSSCAHPAALRFLRLAVLRLRAVLSFSSRPHTSSGAWS